MNPENFNVVSSGQAGLPFAPVIWLAILVLLNIVFFYYIFEALVNLGAILKDHDDNLDTGENKKSYRERTDALCKFTKYECFMHEPRRLLSQLLRRIRLLSSNKILREVNHQNHKPHHDR